MGSKLISFNSGVPDENMKLEIEKNLNEKFSGAKNAGRFVISFSQSKENAPEILNLSSDDFDKRYIELEKRNSGQIFVAFRAIPQLFGLVVEGSGFNREEYLQAFALYNRTIVKPIQQNIIRTFDKIFGVENSITITPFTIDVVDDISTKTEIIK